MSFITFYLDLLALFTGVSSAKSEIKSCLPGPREHRLLSGDIHRFYRGPLPDHTLVGRDYRNHTARSSASCAVECLREDACKSFNFCQDGGLCQLNSAVYSMNMSDLYPSNGCLYYDEQPHGVCLTFEAAGEYQYNYFVLPPPRAGQPYRLDFAVKGKQDAILALSESTEGGAYFDIDIGGWRNARSVIRQAKHSNHFYADAQTPGIMSPNEYRRFWLTYDNGTIQVGRGHEVAPFMAYHDAEGRVDVRHVGVASYLYPNGDSFVSWIFYTNCQA